MASKIDPAEGGLKGFAGTPEYMAPEVVLQPGNRTIQRPDPAKIPLITTKADVFAVGVLTYEVLTRRTAFQFASNNTSLEFYNAILNKEP